MKKEIITSEEVVNFIVNKKVEVKSVDLMSSDFFIIEKERIFDDSSSSWGGGTEFLEKYFSLNSNVFDLELSRFSLEAEAMEELNEKRLSSKPDLLKKINIPELEKYKEAFYVIDDDGLSDNVNIDGNIIEEFIGKFINLENVKLNKEIDKEIDNIMERGLKGRNLKKLLKNKKVSILNI